MALYTPIRDSAYDIDDEAIKYCMQEQLYSDIYNMSEKERHLLLEDPQYEPVRQAMIESGLINKISILKLSKESDLERRNSQAVMALARQDNSDLYKRYISLVAQKNKLKEQLRERYGSRARLLSMKSQKEYLKNNPIGNLVIR